MPWEITFHTPALEQEISDMPAGFLARFIHLAERMELYGPDLGMPHSRAMGSGLFELRLKAAEGIARVFYCTLAGRRIVTLHQFIKKSGKAPARKLKIATVRVKEAKT